jgi:hypothetical protein
VIPEELTHVVLSKVAGTAGLAVRVLSLAITATVPYLIAVSALLIR